MDLATLTRSKPEVPDRPALPEHAPRCVLSWRAAQSFLSSAADPVPAAVELCEHVGPRVRRPVSVGDRPITVRARNGHPRDRPHCDRGEPWYVKGSVSELSQP